MPTRNERRRRSRELALEAGRTSAFVVSAPDRDQNHGGPTAVPPSQRCRYARGEVIGAYARDAWGRRP
jgi:hypothetical protein